MLSNLGVLAIFAIALFQEDAAIVAGGYLVLQGKVRIELALAVIYAGVLIDNFALYVMGAAARRVPAVRRWLIRPAVEQVGEQLRKRAFAAVLLCRLTPGFLIPTFLGCGWFGIPLRRIVLAAMLASAVYLSVMMTLMLVFGELFLQRLREWSWTLPAVIIAVVVIVAGVRWYKQRQGSRLS